MQRELGANGRAKNSARRPYRFYLPANPAEFFALPSVQMIDQSTRPERLKTGADTLKMQTYAKRAEFFALPSVPSFQTPSSLAVSPSPPPLPPALSLAG
jgi:hypothetical protein